MPFFSPKPRSRKRRILTAGEFLEDRVLLAFDPSPMEQEALEHVNRMRTDPQGELDVLFDSLTPILATDANVQDAIEHFNVVSSTLQSQWAQLTAVPPLAWNESLSDAAKLHNDAMVEHKMQAHQLPGEDPLLDRVRNAGYDGNLFLENVYAFAESMLHGHAGFVIDWGDDVSGAVDGIQSPPGHRDNIMSAEVEEIGIAVAEVELDPNDLEPDVGPILITQEFGRQSGYTPQILGVFWEDGKTYENNLGHTGIYDEGEGFGGIDIIVKGDSGTFNTTTMSAGGYQLEVPVGTYEVIVSDFFLGTFAGANVVVGNENVKVDFNTLAANRSPILDDDSDIVPEGGSKIIDVLDNDGDLDGTIDPTTVEIVTQPQQGSVSIDSVTGAITYTSFAGPLRTDTFQYLVRDDDGASGVKFDSDPFDPSIRQPRFFAEVTVTIEETNEPPVASDASFDVVEDVSTPLVIEQFVTDTDGTVDWSTLQITQMPNRGTAIPNSASRGFTYQGDLNFSGTDSFQYQVADNSGELSNVATINITVTDENDAPVAVDDQAATVAGSGKVIDVFANDSDVDSNVANGTVEVASQPQNGTASETGASVEYTPEAGFIGVDSFTYLIRDDSVPSAQSGVATVTVYVADPATPWRNPENPLDVLPDGFITPLDAIRVINLIPLNDLSLPSAVPGLETAPPPFLDVNGNSVVDPLDALLVINDLPSTSNAPLSGRAELAATVDDDEPDAVSGLPTEITSELAETNPRDLAVDLVLNDGVTPTSITAETTDSWLSSLSSAPRRWLAAVDSSSGSADDLEDVLADLAVDVLRAPS